MSNTFRNTPFNQDIGDWNVSSVNLMNEMFYSAHSFNQDIGNWDTSSLSTLTGTFNMHMHLIKTLEIGMFQMLQI